VAAELALHSHPSAGLVEVDVDGDDAAVLLMGEDRRDVIGPTDASPACQWNALFSSDASTGAPLTTTSTRRTRFEATPVTVCT